MLWLVGRTPASHFGAFKVHICFQTLAIVTGVCCGHLSISKLVPLNHVLLDQIVSAIDTVIKLSVNDN